MDNNIKDNKSISEETKALRNVFLRFSQTEDGKKILEMLSKFCFADRSSVRQDNPNALMVFFNEGKRSVFLHIMNYLRKD